MTGFYRPYLRESIAENINLGSKRFEHTHTRMNTRDGRTHIRTEKRTTHAHTHTHTHTQSPLTK